MAKSKKNANFEAKRDEIRKEVMQNLESRGLLETSDEHLIEEYAKEIAFAFVVGEEVLNTSGLADRVRLSRIRNAHLNTANQLARTLRIGPYGRDRFGKESKGAVEEKPTMSITHLIRKAK